MTANIDDFEIEPELSAEEFAFSLEPAEPVGVALNAAEKGDLLDVQIEPSAAAVAAPVALMQILPADFPLPLLTRFCPNPALRFAVDEAAKYALSLEVSGPEGVKRGDAACTALRTALKKMEADFEEPKEIANRLHKQITGTIAEWGGPGKNALDVVGRRVATEQRRLDQIAAEARRKAQEEEDRKERERRRLEAAAAEKAKAPEPVVQEMRRQAETASAPPVAAAAPPKLAGSSVVGTWKARPKGTSGAADPNPAIEDMTVEQKARVMDFLRAIVDAELPMVGFQIDWSYWNKRAKADKTTLDVPGIEAFEDLGLRGRSSRAK